MSEIEEDRVHQHNASFKDPEEPFVAYNWINGHRVEAGNDVDAGGGEVFDCAVDCADGNEKGGDVEGC